MIYKRQGIEILHPTYTYYVHLGMEHCKISSKVFAVCTWKLIIASYVLHKTYTSYLWAFNLLGSVICSVKKSDINLLDLSQGYDVEGLLGNMEKKYQNEITTTIDGLKIDFSDSWVHLRKSNTEHIVRVYSEAPSQEEADALANRFIFEIKSLSM